MRKNRFTLVELLITLTIMIMIVSLVLIIPIVILRGNFWFTENGVLRELQGENPKIVKLFKIDRNVFSLSEIQVKDVNNVSSIYKLDTCVLFNYDLRLSHRA